LNIVHLSGFPAWLAWLFIHACICRLSESNRGSLSVGLAYITFNKGARLITRNFQAEQRPLG